MILITLGTQDKNFYRLLEAVDNAGITQKIVVQAGVSADFKFMNSDAEVFDLIPMEDFAHLIDKCEILITHGGVGSIVAGLKKGKKVIAAARLEKYGEHENDHQTQIIDVFGKEGYIIPLDDFSKLPEKLKEAENFTPKEYQSNTENFISIVRDEIDKYL